MNIEEPFGPWHQGNGPDVIRRDSKDYAFYIFLRNNRVEFSTGGEVGPTVYGPGPSLAEAVAYVDNYIAENFTIEKTAEQKLADAQAEIDLLKQELRVALRQDAHRSAKPFEVGRFVKVTLEGNGNYKRILPIQRVVEFGGSDHYELLYENGLPGLYKSSEIEAVW